MNKTISNLKNNEDVSKSAKLNIGDVGISLSMSILQFILHKSRRNDLVKTAGFSVIELVITIMILGIIGVMAASSLLSMKKTLSVAESNSDEAGSQYSSIYFRNVFLNASTAYHFQQLPITVGSCIINKPCVRRFDPDTRRLIPNDITANDPQLSTILTSMGWAGVGTIQFFKDQAGELSNLAPLNIKYSGTAPINVKTVKVLDTSKIFSTAASSALYVSWPLADETSLPFPVLVRKGSNALFAHSPKFGKSTPPAHRKSLFSGSALTDQEYQDLVGSLVVVYSQDDPRQFFLQFVKSAHSCLSANLSICQSVKNTINTAVTDAELAQLHLLELVNLNDSDAASVLSALNEFSGYLSQVGLSSSYGAWPQNSDTFLFPTLASTLFESIASSSDLTPPLDIRKVQHFYTTKSVTGGLVVLPVELNYYKLQKIPGTNKYNLISKVAGSATETIIIREVFDKSYTSLSNILYFARKIGTSTIEVIIE